MSFVRVVIAVTSVIAVVVAAAVIFQRRFVYYPDPRPAETAGARGDAVVLHTHDGLSLSAWFVPPAAADTGVRVLVCNGNAGNFGDRMPLAVALSGRGFGVLLFDYRGYGGNEGRPSEAGLAADADAAQRWLAEHGGGDRMVYLGESIGAGVCTGLAQRRPPAVLVLRAPSPSLPAAARAQVPIPLGWLLWDQYPVAETVRDLDVPLLVVAGSADTLIPPHLSREVYDAARRPHRLLIIEGAGHNDPRLLDGPAVVDAIVEAGIDAVGGE